MPHVSKSTIPEKTRRAVENQVIAFLSETGSATRERVFRELFTKTEQLMIGKRLALIFLLARDIPTHQIARLLTMSSSSVLRFEKALRQNKYSVTVQWLKRDRIRNKFIRIITGIAAIPFEASRKSFTQFLKEY